MPPKADPELGSSASRAAKKPGGIIRPRPEVVKLVETLIAGQLRPSEIAARVQEKFGLHPRTGHRYIAIVRATMATEEDENRPYHRHYIRATLRTIVQRALARDQLAAAVAAVDRIARLDGLYAETKVDVRHSGSIDQRYVDMPREQRKARLNELFSLYASESSSAREEADAGDGDSN